MEKKRGRGKLDLIEEAKSFTAKLYAAPITITRMLVILEQEKYSREECKAALKHDTVVLWEEIS